MKKIFVSAMAVGAAAGVAVSVEARAESAPAPVTLGAAELDTVKGGQAAIEIRRSFNNRISRSGNSTATVSGSGDDNTATSTSNFGVSQGTGFFINLGAPTTVIIEP
jgi:hypothetical protein